MAALRWLYNWGWLDITGTPGRVIRCMAPLWFLPAFVLTLIALFVSYAVRHWVVPAVRYMKALLHWMWYNEWTDMRPVPPQESTQSPPAHLP